MSFAKKLQRSKGCVLQVMSHPKIGLHKKVQIKPCGACGEEKKLNLSFTSRKLW